jgi:predicted permease
MRFLRWRYVIPLRLRSLFRSTAVERELDDELRYHLECQIEANVARGMGPADARHAALRALGNVALHKDACRDRRRTTMIDHAIRDTRYAARVLIRSPIFATVAILSLALGIGANAAIFELIDTIRLRSLAVANPQELGEVRLDGPQAFGNYEGINARATFPVWEQIRTQQHAFSRMFAWGDTGFPVGRGAEARGVRGLWVSGDFFAVLGITPERGRLLAASDDRRGCGAGSAVVSHAFWQSYFGGQESAIGGSLLVLDLPFTVVGVVPASFTGLEVGRGFDIALPLCSAELWDRRLDRSDHWWLTIMGRLEPGWTFVRADEHIRSLGPGILEATIAPGYDAGLINGYRQLRFGVEAAATGVSRLRDVHGSSLTLLLGLTGLVLLMTCGNLATLMLARASGRAREVAVRAALGASRGRLVSQMSIESVLVAAAGAALAVPVAVLSARALVTLLETPTSPVTLDLAGDRRLIAFVGATATITAILFGLFPALRVSLANPVAVMRQASRGLTLDRHRARFQRGLVVVQIAVSLVLILSALLFVQTFRNLAAVKTGFDPADTFVIWFRDHASQALSPEHKIAFQDRLTDEIRSIPGVVAAAASTHVPLSGGIWSHFFRVLGTTASQRNAGRFAYVSPGYFDTLKIPLRSGRGFTDRDTLRGQRVMIVNESFVRSHLEGVTPIGATLRTIEEPGYPEVTYEVIGVVGDTKYADLRDENCWCKNTQESMAPIAYVPIAQIPSPYAWAPMLVRSSVPVAGLARTVAARVERLNPAIAVDFVDLTTTVRERLLVERMVAWLAGAFAVLAIALVAVGLYGIVAYLAASRRREIGIRLALGATRAQIIALVLRDNVGVMFGGLAIGVPLAVAAMRAASALLFGLSPTDVPTVLIATGVLVLAGVFAATIPAWRAAHIRLDDALRCD